ncbi:MAG: MFS transporter [Bacteroidota bacterium]
MNKTKIPRNILILGIVSLLTDAATEMIYPFLPLFIATLGSGAVLLGIIEGIAETTASLLKLVSGIISDKIGKRKALVVVGYTISTFARPLIGVVADAWQIALIRTMDRVGKGIRTSPRDALIASSVTPESRGRAFGFHRAMDHSGAVLGPLLGIGTIALLILVFGQHDLSTILRTTFLFAIIPGALAVLTLMLFVKENAVGHPGRPAFSFSLRSFDAQFKRYLFTVAFFTLGNSSDAFMLFRLQETLQNSTVLHSFISSVPLFAAILDRFAESQTQIQISNILFLPIIWSFFQVIKALLSTPLGGLSDRIGRKMSINIGWGIYAAVYAGFASLEFLSATWQIAGSFGLFTVYAVYYAFTEGAEKALVADIVPDELRGSAYGLFNFAVGIVALPASIIFGIIYSKFGGAAAFGMGAVISLVSMIFLSVGLKERR